MTNKPPPRVVLFEHTKLDVTTAAEYGQPLELFKQHDRSSIFDDALKNEIVERLERIDYDPAHDYFIVAGTQVATIIMATTIVAKYGKARVLFFDVATRKYVPKWIGNIAHG